MVLTYHICTQLCNSRSYGRCTVRASIMYSYRYISDWPIFITQFVIACHLFQYFQQSFRYITRTSCFLLLTVLYAHIAAPDCNCTFTKYSSHILSTHAHDPKFFGRLLSISCASFVLLLTPIVLY
jgi:hypothetical protein